MQELTDCFDPSTLFERRVALNRSQLRLVTFIPEFAHLVPSFRRLIYVHLCRHPKRSMEDWVDIDEA